MNKNKNAFTLIELMIAVIIVGTLAAISWSMAFQGVKMRAIATEAITAMSCIRQAERVYYAEYGTYTSSIVYDLGIKEEELNGVYFSFSCYFPPFVNWPGPKGVVPLLIRCWPLSSDINYAPKASEVNNRESPWDSQFIYMDQDGNVYSYIKELGYPVPPV